MVTICYIYHSASTLTLTTLHILILILILYTFSIKKKPNKTKIMYPSTATLQNSLAASPALTRIYSLEVHSCLILFDIEICLLVPGIKILLCLK